MQTMAATPSPAEIQGLAVVTVTFMPTKGSRCQAQRA